MPGRPVESKRKFTDAENIKIQKVINDKSTERQKLIAQIILYSQINNITPNLITTNIFSKFKIKETEKNKRNLSDLVRKILHDLNDNYTIENILKKRGKGNLIKKEKEKVTIKRKIKTEELTFLNKNLNFKTKPSRKNLIAKIIKNSIDGMDNLENAKQIVKIFPITISKDPIATTRSLVLRIISDINDNKSLVEIIQARGKGNFELTKWTQGTVKQKLKKLHNQNPTNFNYKQILKTESKLLSHIENKSNFRNALIDSGINPLVHLDDMVWGDELEAKKNLEFMLRDIINRCGISSINYNSMYSTQSAILGINKNAHEKYNECNKFGCIKRIKGGAIVRKISNLFGDYKVGVCKLLSISEDDYNQLIERKPFNVKVSDYLNKLKEFIDTSDEMWTIAQFSRKEKIAHHGLHNKKSELTFINDASGDVMVASVAQITFENLKISKKKFLIDYFPDIEKETRSRKSSNKQIRLEGYIFQRLFLEMLEDEELGLKKNQDFFYEKFIDSKVCEQLGHNPKCKMDFIFNDFVIDTKRSVISGSKSKEKTQRYLEHTDHLIYVTLRQHYKSTVLNNKKFTIMTVYDFIDKSKNLLGTQIHDSWKKKFKNYALASSKRIQTEQDIIEANEKNIILKDNQ